MRGVSQFMTETCLDSSAYEVLHNLPFFKQTISINHEKQLLAHIKASGVGDSYLQ